MPVRIVIGAQYGDEAKGKIADYLAAESRIVVRTGGGPNAGHSIQLAEGSVVLHQVAVGALRPETLAISGPGMVVQPTRWLEEVRDLEAKGLLRGEPMISDRAHVLLPLHEVEDGWEDELRARADPAGGIGTTRRGIGPAYADRYARFGLRFAELRSPDRVKARLDLLYERKRGIPGLPDRGEVESGLAEAVASLGPRIRNVGPILFEALDRGETILLEGAQSALLDIDFGTYPFVTSSHPTSAGALVGSGLPPQAVSEVVAVAKAYTTRVGGGPFTTRAEPEEEKLLQTLGGERGATTGRPRQCGWLDLVQLRYVARMNGVTSLAITKIDVLGGRETVPVCTEYRAADGTRYTDDLPAAIDGFEGLAPVYEHLPGWPSFDGARLERLRREGARALPPEVRRFLGFVQDRVGVPVRLVGYGPRREETLRLPSAPGRPRSLARWTG
ncbi:MAG: adenylosuccinate synthase [Thermoplasmata archaeon]